MENTRGINVPSRHGRFVKTYSEAEVAVLKSVHGVNWFNISLLIEAWVTFLSDSPLHLDQCMIPNHVYHQFRAALIADPLEIIGRYSLLCDTLLSQLRVNRDGSSIGPFLEDFKRTPIFGEYLRFFRTQDDTLLKYLISFLWFGKKFYYDNRAIESDALRSWLDVEERLELLEIPSWVSSLRLILEDLDTHFQPVLLPSHGKGYVAESTDRSVLKKNEVMSEDLRFRMLCEWTSPGSYARVIPDTAKFDWRNVTANRVARLKFVPKTWKSRRSICMEPAYLQWAQQSVRLALEDAIERSRFGSIIRIKDQSYNQEGSQFGSRTQLVDTIDLSAASDSVHIDLVRRIFPRKVLKFLLATRSVRVELPKGAKQLSGKSNIIAPRKFAPMGSALCFPVQCLIFTAVVELAGLMHHYEVEANDVTPSMVRGPRPFGSRYHEGNGVLQPSRVYGDDIICDSRLTHTVTHLLYLLGFRTNKSKSFVGDSSFRESCGAFHFLGRDVTPIYFRIGRSTGTDISVAKLSAIVDLCNYSRTNRYFRLGTYLQKLALTLDVTGVKKHRESKVNPILFSDHPESLAIRAEKPTNRHLTRRVYDPSSPYEDTRFWYQRDEISSIGVVAKASRGLDDTYSYVLWQRSRRVPLGNSVVSADRGPVGVVDQRVRHRWTVA